jgi:endonuclease YncB( thermonuclease family)
VKLLLCAMLIVLSGMAQAEEFTTKVIAVLDGDTVLIRRAKGVLKIRLADIDAPEKAQPFGASISARVRSNRCPAWCWASKSKWSVRRWISTAAWSRI